MCHSFLPTSTMIRCSVMADFASESGHWYKPDGTPCYTIVGANGKERPTTLRDAKKHGLLPSVTTILRCAAAPGLENWKAEQLLLSALTLERQEGENEKDWLSRVRRDSQEQARKAAEEGSRVHGAIEGWFLDNKCTDEMWPIVCAVADQIDAAFGPMEWKPEKSFASPLGYGGKVDLHADGIVLDFKGKEGDLSDVKCYENHYMQCAAYAHGLGMPDAQCGIVFFSRDQAKAKLVLHEKKDTERYWKAFLGLLDYWKAKSYG
jgi:hypothetical protein